MLYGELPAAGGFKYTNRNPPKTAILRLPTSEEMMRRLAQQKTIRTSLGRRQSKSDVVANPKADVELFAAIRVDKDGAAFDEHEARRAILEITYCEVTSCERDGENLRLVLKTPFCETVHVMRDPTEKDRAGYQPFTVTDLPHNREELRWQPESSVKFYDALAVSADGYRGDIPAHHKLAIASEVAAAIADEDPPFDPNA